MYLHVHCESKIKQDLRQKLGERLETRVGGGFANNKFFVFFLPDFVSERRKNTLYQKKEKNFRLFTALKENNQNHESVPERLLHVIWSPSR